MNSVLPVYMGLVSCKCIDVLFHMLAGLFGLALTLFMQLASATYASTEGIFHRVDDIAQLPLKNAYLIEGNRPYFGQPAVDYPPTARASAIPVYSWLWGFLFFLKVQPLAIARSVKRQYEPVAPPLLVDSPPSPESTHGTLLKGSLIPDGVTYREYPEQAQKTERALANWQYPVHGHYQSSPVVLVSVKDAQVRMVISAEQTFRNLNISSFYEDHLDMLLQSYLSLSDDATLNNILLEWAFNLPASPLSSGSGGGGDGDDDDDGNNQSYDGSEPDPLIVVFEGETWPTQDSPEKLLSKTLENKRRLLRIVHNKLQRAIAEGNSELVKILGDRIMLIEVELDGLERSGQQLSPVVLSRVKAAFTSDQQALQDYDDQSLRLALPEHPATVNVDPDSLIIRSDEMSQQQMRFYSQWLHSAPGLIYSELKQRLLRQLRRAGSYSENHLVAVDTLLIGLEICIRQFRSLGMPGSATQRIGRQAPNSDTQTGHSEKTSASQPSTSQPSTSQKRQAPISGSGLGKKRCTKHLGGGDGGNPSPFHNRHTRNNHCPTCNNGPCEQRANDNFPANNEQALWGHACRDKSVFDYFLYELAREKKLITYFSRAYRQPDLRHEAGPWGTARAGICFGTHALILAHQNNIPSSKMGHLGFSGFFSSAVELTNLHKPAGVPVTINETPISSENQPTFSNPEKKQPPVSLSYPFAQIGLRITGRDLCRTWDDIINFISEKATKNEQRVYSCELRQERHLNEAQKNGNPDNHEVHYCAIRVSRSGEVDFFCPNLGHTPPLSLDSFKELISLFKCREYRLPDGSRFIYSGAVLRRVQPIDS